ncbi:DUF4369 domain-containing protein [Streptomyces sp. NPDC005808]|uniref:DUF4369 domain-containing protein n=1 Tax=Streptomyces sp. NPDC005808 TaxID=3364734 RepID=UPI00368A3AE5
MNVRIAAVSLATAALVAGGATAANAAVPTAKAPAITVSASTTKAKTGQSIAITGRVTGLKDGSKVTLQEKVNGKWVTLESTTVKKGTYKITDKVKTKGTETLRVVDGKTVSKSVTVTVR